MPKGAECWKKSVAFGWGWLVAPDPQRE